MKVLHLIIIYFLVTSLKISAQNFQDVTISMGLSFVNGGNQWGTGVSFFDFDEDGWDDLTICVAGSPTRVYRNSQGTFELFWLFPNMTETKQPIWFDYDNDGFNDLLITRKDNPHQLFRNIANNIFEDVSYILNIDFDNSTYAFGTSLSFGGSVGDPNRDGFLDVAIANNGLANGSFNSFRWNLSGEVFYADSTNQFTQFEGSSFQPVWVDFDFDGFQELYVINDFHQGNEFYKRNDEGIYSERSEEYGLNYPMNAMSNSWCDFDNDGDLDVYLTNSTFFCSPECVETEGNVFLINENNQFQNEASLHGLVLNKWTWGALWIDTDNKGYSDLLINERNIDPNKPFEFGIHLMKNINGTFENANLVEFTSFDFPYYTSAKGDFNNDGKYDVFLSSEMFYPYKLLENSFNGGGNYLKMKLIGRIGNRNGFGTTYKMFCGNEVFTGQLFSSESYLCQNSQRLIQGLSNHDIVDSIKVFWTSGVVDSYFNIPSNQEISFLEGETLRGIVATRDYLCVNVEDSVLLSVPDWQNVEWENGQSSNNRWVSNPGHYVAEVNNGFGRRMIFSIDINEGFNQSVDLQVSNISCNDLSDGSYQLISEGDTLFSADNLNVGIYNVDWILPNGCPYRDTVIISQPEELQLLLPEVVTVCSDSAWNAEYIVSGGTLPYFSIGFAENQLLEPGIYNLTIIDENECEVSSTLSVISYLVPTVSALIEGDDGSGSGEIQIIGEGIETVQWENSNSFFIDNLDWGIYSCQMYYGNECVIDTIFTVNLVNQINNVDSENILIFQSGLGLFNNSRKILSNVKLVDLSGRTVLVFGEWYPEEIKFFADIIETGLYLIFSDEQLVQKLFVHVKT